MESLRYAFEGRGFLFTDDTGFPVDSLINSRNMLKKWDEEPLSVPTIDAVEDIGFVEPLQFLESSCNDTSDRSRKSVHSASTASLNSLTGRNRFSNSVNKANDEKLASKREQKGSQFSIDNSVLSSPEHSVSAKRARIMNLQSPTPTCQVYGCNQDLSSSKDYHKRHKVCDVHSKTPVVIVKGIQQRFCQQCSRFHILAEFDEGKRSCRKRLAGHNERRRKPQFDTHLGSTYLTTEDASKASLLFSRILPAGFFGLQYNEPTNHSRHLKFGQDPNQSSHSLPKSVLHFHGTGKKQHPSRNFLDVPLSVPELPAASNTGCALSLLSAQSQSLLSNSATVLITHPLITKENLRANNLCSVQNSAKPLGISTSLNFIPVTSNSSGIVPEGLDFEIPKNELSQEQNGLDVKNYLASEGANTVNLLELSLHLQRVEQQKDYGQVKLENAIVCPSMIT